MKLLHIQLIILIQINLKQRDQWTVQEMEELKTFMSFHQKEWHQFQIRATLHLVHQFIIKKYFTEIFRRSLGLKNIHIWSFMISWQSREIQVIEKYLLHLLEETKCKIMIYKWVRKHFKERETTLKISLVE